MKLNVSKCNYRSLVVAGLGSVGSALLRLGEKRWGCFERFFLIDKNINKLNQSLSGSVVRIHGDITDRALIDEIRNECSGPILLVNTCSGIDTVVLRKLLQSHPVGYIDPGGSATPEIKDRFSRIMPYTNQALHGDFPHLLCQGINPGLVEITARRLMGEFSDKEKEFQIRIIENDQLFAPTFNKIAVGWSIQDFIDETIAVPAMEMVRGAAREFDDSRPRKLIYDGKKEPFWAIMTGHEDVWNLGLLPDVGSVQFWYALRPEVMDVLGLSATEAISKIGVPGGYLPVECQETVTVEVRGVSTNLIKAASWTEDHGKIWSQYGMNAVGYQTAKGILLAMELMLHTDFGVTAGTFNSSLLPLDVDGWDIVGELCRVLQVDWKYEEVVSKVYKTNKIMAK